MPNGPNGPFCGSESVKVGDPHSTGPSAGGAALRAAPLALGSVAGGGGSPTVADLEPRRGPIGLSGALGPQSLRAGCWAPI
eukprot:9419010-Alexandrium_andersonii.AAC.1